LDKSYNLQVYITIKYYFNNIYILNICHPLFPL